MGNVEEASHQPSRVEALDSARGWAILGVIAIHVSQSVGLSAGILHRFAVNGDMGVELFYVLSAFSLMMMLNLRSEAGRHSLSGYFIRRFFRIAPMFWFALLIATIEFYGKTSFWSPNGIGPKEVSLTAIFLHGIDPETVNAVIPGGWSVAIEVMFYALLPVLFKYTATSGATIKWLAGSLLIYFSFGNYGQQYFDQVLPENALHLSSIFSWYMSFPAQLPVFIMGILAYQAVHAGQVSPRVAYGLSCVGFLLLIGAPLSAEEHMLPRHLAWGAVFALFIMANVQRPYFVFDNPLMRLLGRISYSTYLLHFFVITFVGKLFRHVTIQDNVKFVLFYLVVVGITYFMASWSYRVIELTGMKVGSEISRKLEMKVKE